MDGTFDQDHQRERVREWTEQGKFLHSIDLSAATDRFPALFQMLSLYLSGAFNFKQSFS
jgi:hypothetical protein